MQRLKTPVPVLVFHKYEVKHGSLHAKVNSLILHTSVSDLYSNNKMILQKIVRATIKI